MMNVAGSSTPVPVPFASLGPVKVDDQGRYTLHGTSSIGGQIQDADSSGSIQVNPDCTGTATDSFGGAARLVILENGNEIRSMATKGPLGRAAGIGYFRRIAWREWYWPCTADMVRGEYRGTAEGTYMVPVPGQPQPVPTPFSGIFTMSFQHGGTGTAVATASMAGTIFDVEFPKMSIEVNPDCTATMKYTGGFKQLPGQTFTGTIKYIVLDYGNELMGMETESNVGLPIELENHKRISMIPVGPDR